MSLKKEALRAGLTRRDLIRLGLVSGAALQGLKAGPARAQTAPGDIASPPVTPFSQEMPVPPVLRPVETLSPAPNPNAHQRFAEFAPRKLYEVHQVKTTHTFHRELGASDVFAYNGIVPGPTLEMRYGEPVLVRHFNDLPANHVGFGIPEVITHLHNAHTATESDGFPQDFFPSGQFKDHHYANIFAGGDEREALGSLWYHDHRVEFTAQNVYRGLAGTARLFDEVDSGDENDPNPRALRLPSGEYDIPLVFNDRLFDPNTGALVFDDFNLDGFLGDRYTMNGVVLPFFRAQRRKYRLRLLNASVSRYVEFVFSDGRSFTQISSDGNLLARPFLRNSIRIAPAERADIIVDFAKYSVGRSVILQNRLEQDNGQGPTGRLLSPREPVMRFDIVSNPPVRDVSRVPSILRAMPPIEPNTAVQERVWEFDRRQGVWIINGRVFDPDDVRAQVKQGTAEIWTLRNPLEDWSHPIHIHLEEFRLISRQNGSPPTDERGRKDVIRLGPNQQVRIFMRFRDFLGRYVMHCHNLVHEDHAMMLRWDVVP